MRVDNPPVMLLLGVALEHLEARSAQYRRVHGETTQGLRSPSLEVLDDASAAAIVRARPNRARLLSLELLDAPRPGPSARNTARRTTQRVRSPSLEVLDDASAAAVVRRRPKRARELSLELVDAPRPGPSSRARVRSPSVEIIG